MQKITSSRRRGESHPQARFTDSDVQQAVELVERYGLSIREVARKFECSPATIHYWVNGRYRSSRTAVGE